MATVTKKTWTERPAVRPVSDEAAAARLLRALSNVEEAAKAVRHYHAEDHPDAASDSAVDLRRFAQEVVEAASDLVGIADQQRAHLNARVPEEQD